MNKGWPGVHEIMVKYAYIFIYLFTCIISKYRSMKFILGQGDGTHYCIKRIFSPDEFLNRSKNIQRYDLPNEFLNLEKNVPY
jgi:hypothetical protein